MVSRTAVKILLAFVLGLPVLMTVLRWVGGLLTAMGDASATTVLQHLNTGASVLWLVSVVGLVIALAVQNFEDPREQ